MNAMVYQNLKLYTNNKIICCVYIKIHLTMTKVSLGLGFIQVFSEMLLRIFDSVALVFIVHTNHDLLSILIDAKAVFQYFRIYYTQDIVHLNNTTYRHPIYIFTIGIFPKLWYANTINCL